MNTNTTRPVRHPLQIPVEVNAASARPEKRLPSGACRGMLLLHLPHSIDVGIQLTLRLPTLGSDAVLHGQVAWLARSGNGYQVCLSFGSDSEAFRMRMLEQLCHIEAYRRRVQREQGRRLTTEQAASEWIERYAGDFPQSQSIN